MKRILMAFAVAAFVPIVWGQSLYEQEVAPPPERGEAQGTTSEPTGPPAPAASNEDLEQVSLTAIRPPQPREFAKHDLVTIIISEKNKFERDQTLKTEKDYSTGVTLRQFLDLKQLFENAALRNGIDEEVGIDLTGGHDYEGDGEYEREDNMTGRITAQVLEVKPNGTLVLEARTSLVTDEEEQHIMLTGVCRSEDVTTYNTVQSNQLFDLRLDIQNRGSVEKASRKGLIPNILETLFNF